MINIPGLIGIIVFYILILVVGLLAARKSKSTEKNPDTEDVMLAGRNIGLVVGIFTMTATWVGGGYINGTAEMVYKKGLVWCQAPIGYSLSVIMGGIFFARHMRERRYVTLLDPFQQKYGARMGGLLFIPALFGEVCWSAAILSALGSTLSVIIGLNNNLAIIISACIAVFYTLFGGLYAVAYTDIIQFLCIVVGLIVGIPYAMTNVAVTPIAETASELWIGTVETKLIAPYIDKLFLLICGGIPWQAYFQRVLSSKSPARAQYLSYVAGVGCFVMAIPPILIGAVAKSTDWNATDYPGEIPIPPEQYKLVLPMVLQYLCPGWVSFIGLGAISAAVMSSADSSVLSASTMFARNVYKTIFRQKASEREVLWIMRVAIIMCGALATVMGIAIPSIYGLFILCSDLVYVVLFPQFVSVIYLKFTNTYGSIVAYFLSFLLRVLGGESLINLEPVMKYPYYDEEYGQLFPFKTFIMLLSLLVLCLVSFFTNFMFTKGYIPKKYDILKCTASESNGTSPEQVKMNGNKESENGDYE